MKTLGKLSGEIKQQVIQWERNGWGWFYLSRIEWIGKSVS